METKIIEGQSLFDIAIQECGSIESVFDIAMQNDLSIIDRLTAGQMIDLSGTSSNEIADYYRVRGLTPATDLTVILEGIGFWRIGHDFVVSNN